MAKPGIVQAMSLLLALSPGAGCYEIPPAILRGGSAPPGWAPAAVYVPEPFHPLNRWFQRAFAPRGANGEILPVASDEPLPLAGGLSPVDCAELIALLEAIEPGDLEGAGTAWIWRSDALECACRLSEVARRERAEPVCRDLLDRLLDACRYPAGAASLLEEGSLAPVLAPPPLRQGAWSEREAALAPELLPSADDLRWTRLLAAGGGGPAAPKERLLLLRLRAGLEARGAPLLIPVASECWEIEEQPGGEPGVRRWRFDRARWAMGEDPWRDAQPGEAERARLVPLILAAPAPAAANSSKASQYEAIESVLRVVMDSHARNR